MTSHKVTVQEAIDQLMAIEDKTQPLQLEIFGGNNWGIDFEKVEMSEYPKSESFEAHVQVSVHLEENSAHLHCNDNQVVVDLDEATIRAISYLKEPGTDKPLSDQAVIQTLANDLGLTNSRSGSWEGSNMQAVIDGHGWESHFGQ